MPLPTSAQLARDRAQPPSLGRLKKPDLNVPDSRPRECGQPPPNVTEAERGLFSVTPKGKARVTGRKILLTLRTTKHGGCLRAFRVLSETDCPAVGHERLRCRQLRVGRPERPTLALWGCREGRANGTKGSQGHVKISGQSRLPPTSPPHSFTKRFSALC